MPPVLFMFTIYLMNNPAARLLFGGNMRVMAIDQQWFLIALTDSKLVCTGAERMDQLPGWYRADLSDNALPIFLSRPISRFEYVLGKLIVLDRVPVGGDVAAACCFCFCSRDTPRRYRGSASHLFIAFGVFAGALIWIAFFAIAALSRCRRG